jgi:5'-AMP-activated protein kinase regulatory gamma subunit
VHRLVVVDDEDKVIGIISLSDLFLFLVLRPCGEDGSPDGVASVRAQDIRLQESISQSERTSSAEEVSQTIPEEEEDPTVEKNTQDDKSENHKDDSDTSLPDSPVIESNPLPNENNMFREVTVTGGGE